MTQLLRQVAPKLKFKDSEGKEEPGRVPLLVIEIESRPKGDDLVRTIFSNVKVLVVDRRAAKAVFILNDSFESSDFSYGTCVV